MDGKSAIMNSWALNNVLNFFLDPYQFHEMILMKLMGKTGGDKEYVSVCPRVVVNTPEKGVWTACREALQGRLQAEDHGEA